MRKLLLASLALLFASAALSGCRVEGEIDPAGDVSYTGVQPR